MKGEIFLKFDPEDRRAALRLLTILIILIVAVQNLSVVAAGLGWVWRVCLPVTVGFSIAFVLNVLLSYLEEVPLAPMRLSGKKWIRGMTRPLSLGITVVAAVGLLSLAALAAAPRIQSTAALLVDNMQLYVDNLAAWLTDRMRWLHVPEKYIRDITTNLQDLTSVLMSYIQSNQRSLAGVAVGVTTSVVDVTFTTVLGVFIALYVLAAKEKIARVSRRIGEVFLPERVNRFLGEMASLAYATFARFVRGQVVEACVLGVTCALGMWALRLPHAVVVSLVVAATALIPVAGIWMGGVMGAFLLLLIDPVKALIFVAFLTVLHQLERRFLFPRLVEKSSALPGLVIVCAVIVAGNIGGAVGMLIGVPVASILYELTRRLVEGGFPPRPRKKGA